MTKPARKSRFADLPQDLADLVYIVEVAEGRRSQHEMSVNLHSCADNPPKAEDYKTPADAYRLGMSQGFYAEIGGRYEVPTPPVGMARNLLPHFVTGVMAGAEGVKMARAVSVRGGGTSGRKSEPNWTPIVDPFDDIHAAADDTPGLDPADTDDEVWVDPKNPDNIPPSEMCSITSTKNNSSCPIYLCPQSMHWTRRGRLDECGECLGLGGSRRC